MRQIQFGNHRVSLNSVRWTKQLIDCQLSGMSSVRLAGSMASWRRSPSSLPSSYEGNYGRNLAEEAREIVRDAD